jgi:TPR repeat protein
MSAFLMITLLALIARIALQRPALAMASDEESPNPLQEAAEAGDREAMYRLGWALEHGQGLPADLLEAASWYRRAADEGHDQAASGLERVLASDDYRDARYMAEDREAFDHDLEMVAATRLPAVFRVGSGIDGGLEKEMVEVDSATLLEGVKARQTERISQLASLYLSNMIKTGDSAVVARWLRRAAVRGMLPAMGSYALMLAYDRADTPRDLTEALRWINKSAAGGYAPAKFGLWVLREMSPGLVPLDEAVAGLREAAEAEVGVAQLAYGQLLKEGRLVPRDEELGRSYIKKAIKNGYSTRGRTPKYLYTRPETGTPETRSPKTGSTKKAKGPKRKKRR